MIHWATDTEIECPDCEGHGYDIFPEVDCDACLGKGWRAPTADELDNAAEAAYERQLEGEPPMSFSERAEMQAKRDAQWGAK